MKTWDKTNQADVHSRPFKFFFYHDQLKKIVQEKRISHNYPTPEWYRRLVLMPGDVSNYNREKSIYGSDKEPKFLTVCRRWAKKKRNVCLVRVAASIVYHYLYVSKKLGQNNHDTVDNLGPVLFRVFLWMVDGGEQYSNQYIELFFNNANDFSRRKVVGGCKD